MRDGIGAERWMGWSWRFLEFFSGAGYGPTLPVDLPVDSAFILEQEQLESAEFYL